MTINNTKLFFTTFLLLTLISTGCTTVDLTSEENRQTFKPIAYEITSTQIKAKVIQKTDPSDSYRTGQTVLVNATDIWESTLVRWFTPVTEKNQQFQARLELFENGIEFTFLNGEKKDQVIGYHREGAYELVNGEKRTIDSSITSLYLGPLQSYFEWHQTLLRKETAELMGTKDINGISYEILYVTEGPRGKLEKFDQYLVYVNRDTRTVDFVEFTMRELMESYKGVVHYRDYRSVQGILMPHWIGIGDEVEEPGFDHYFVVDSFRFQ